MFKDKKFFQKLKNLKKIEPRLDWVKSNRDILLSQIKAQKQELVETKKANLSLFNRLSKGQIFRALWREDFLWLKKLAQVAIRPVGTIILIIVLVLGSGVLAVNASYSSLPGDALYPLKLTTEKVQLSLSFDEKDKIALEVEFAGRRIDELNKVTAVKNNIKEEKIKIPLQKFTEEITNVNTRLENLEKSGRLDEVIKLASLVDRQTETYSQNLEVQKKDIPRAVKNNVKEALTALEKTSDKAVSIIIERQGQVEELTKELLTTKVGEKINKAEEKINQLQDEISKKEIKETNLKSEEVKKIIDKAKEFLENGDLNSAFAKVKESNELTRNIEEVIEGKGEATAETGAGILANPERTNGTSLSEEQNLNNSDLNTNISKSNIEPPIKVEGNAIINENKSVSGSLLFEEKK